MKQPTKADIDWALEMVDIHPTSWSHAHSGSPIKVLKAAVMATRDIEAIYCQNCEGPCEASGNCFFCDSSRPCDRGRCPDCGLNPREAIEETEALAELEPGL